MATPITATPKLYIGIDKHKRNWAIHIRTDISDHKPLIIPPKTNLLYDHVNKNFPLHEMNIVYEAGCCGFSGADRVCIYITTHMSLSIIIINKKMKNLDDFYFFINKLFCLIS